MSYGEEEEIRRWQVGDGKEVGRPMPVYAGPGEYCLEHYSVTRWKVDRQWDG